MRAHLPNFFAQACCALLPFAACAFFAIKAVQSYTSNPVYSKSWIRYRQDEMMLAMIGFKTGDSIAELKSRVGEPIFKKTMRDRDYLYFSPANRMTGSMGDKWLLLDVVASPGDTFSGGQVLQWQWIMPNID